MLAHLIATASGDVTKFTEVVAVPVAVAVIGVAGALLVAAISSAVASWSAATARRREGYAEAVRELVAWAEYPYRIRRRTSDNSDVLSDLAKLGHQHQEVLRCREMWIAGENSWVGKVYEAVRTELGGHVGGACRDAWTQPPAAAAADMNLNGWGPGKEVDPHIKRFEKAVAFRFGWRRMIALLRWHPGA